MRKKVIFNEEQVEMLWELNCNFSRKSWIMRKKLILWENRDFTRKSLNKRKGCDLMEKRSKYYEDKIVILWEKKWFDEKKVETLWEKGILWAKSDFMRNKI